MASPSQEKSSGAEEVPTIDVHKAKSLIESGHVYLDVRMEEDFRAAHADADAVWKQRAQLVAEAAVNDAPKKIHNVPYYVHTPQGRVKNPQFLEGVRKIFKEDVHLVVGCGTGGRSCLATADLLTAGMKNVNNLGGGYRAWEKNGFPVIKQQEEQSI